MTNHPSFLRAWACLGALFEAKNNHEVARRCYEKALALETQAYYQAFLKEAIERQIESSRKASPDAKQKVG